MFDNNVFSRLKNNKLSYWFSLYIALLPILQYYKSPISILNLATFISVVFFGVFILVNIVKNKHTYVISKNLLPVRVYIIYITTNVIITSFIYSRGYNWDNVSVYFRMLCLMFSLLILGYKFFDKNVAVKILGNFLVLCSILIFFQDVLYYVFSKGINFNIAVLLTDPDYAQARNRFAGLYMEPAHFAQSAILFLCLVLFDEKKQYSKLTVYIIVLGIILSGSGQGYLMLAILFFMWLFTSFSKHSISKNKFIIILSVSIIIVISCFFLSRTAIVSNALARVISDQGLLNSTALLGRTYTNVFFDRLDANQKWFGVGFGHEYDIVNKGLYINSLYSYLIQCGYTSIVLFVFIFGFLFIKGQLKERLFIPIYALMMYFASIANPMMLCFYFLFLLPEYNNNISKYDNT